MQQVFKNPNSNNQATLDTSVMNVPAYTYYQYPLSSAISIKPEDRYTAPTTTNLDTVLRYGRTDLNPVTPSVTPAATPPSPAPVPNTVSIDNAIAPRNVTNRASVKVTPTKQSFIKEMTPYAVEVGKKLGIDPRVIIGQAALETGWGKHAPQNNYFGIKGKGGTYTTTEVINGKPITTTASFRGYKDMGDSVRGYGDFILNNKRYANAIGLQDPYEYLTEISKAGYATDPNYRDKIMQIVNGIKI